MMTHKTDAQCAKFDFDERLFEKLVRLEHSSSRMMKSFEDISKQVKEDLGTNEDRV